MCLGHTQNLEFGRRPRGCRAVAWAIVLFGAINLPTSFAAVPSVADNYTWRNVEILGGGFVTGVVFHPREPNLIYARTDVGGAYRWLPESQSWRPLNDDLTRDEAHLLGVLSLALDPADPERIFMVCGQYVAPWAAHAAVLISADRGASWRIRPLPFKAGGNADGRAAGERLQVDPRDGRVLWLGSNQDGLWKSNDRGESWNRVESFPAQSITVVALSPLPADEDVPTRTIYVGAAGREAGVWRSTDAGESWQRLRGQPRRLIPNHIAFDPAGACYVSYANHLGPNDMTDGAVWKLDLASDRWTNVTPIKPRRGDRFGYGAVSTSPEQPGLVMATTNDRWSHGDEIFRSTDGGRTWSALWSRSRAEAGRAAWVHWQDPPEDYVPHWMGDIDIDPHDPDRVLFVTGAGIWGTTDVTPGEGAPIVWRFLNDGLEETVPQWLLSPPEGPPLVSALADIAGFRHDDLDRSPPQGMHRPAQGSSFSIDFAGLRPEFFVRTQAGGVQRGFYSEDGARTWTAFPSIPPEARSNRGGHGAIAVSADAGSMVWIPKDGPTYFSTDRGATWQPSRGAPTDPDSFETLLPVADRVDPGVFYVYEFASGNVFVSSDGGASFSITTALPAEGWYPRAVPGHRGHAWFPAEEELFVTRDAGATFSRVENVDKAYAVGFGKAAPGQNYPVVFLSGVINGDIGIYRSDDGGDRWLRINDDEHQFGWIITLTGDPRVFGRVYLGTGGRGIIYGEPRD